MAFTVQHVETRVRDLISDNIGTKRWTPEVLLLWICDAITLIVAKRPDAKYTSETQIATGPVTLPTSVTSPVPLNDFWKEPIVDYVCFRALERDADDPTNFNLAASHFKAFASRL